LFENLSSMRSLLSECCNVNKLSCWIGEDLQKHAPTVSACSVIAVPYRINQTIAGAIAILGPHRIPYRRLFGILQASSEYISKTLTSSMYKFKIAFRQPTAPHLDFKNHLLLEDKTYE